MGTTYDSAVFGFYDSADNDKCRPRGGESVNIWALGSWGMTKMPFNGYNFQICTGVMNKEKDKRSRAYACPFGKREEKVTVERF